MSVEVYIPTPFRRATNNKDKVSVDAQDVRGLLDELEDRFGAVPDALVQRIEASSDLQRLQTAVRQVYRIQKLDDLPL